MPPSSPALYRDVSLARPYAIPRTLPALAWRAFMHSFVPELYGKLANEGSHQNLVVLGNAPMSIMSHFAAKPNLLDWSFLRWWYQQIGPVVAGLVVVNQVVSPQDRTRLVQFLHSGGEHAEGSEEDSDHPGSLSCNHVPDLSASVGIALDSTVLHRTTKTRLVENLTLPHGGGRCPTWTPTATVVLAVKELIVAEPSVTSDQAIQQEAEKELAYLAATFAVAFLLWIKATHSDDDRQRQWRDTVKDLTDCKDSLLPTNFLTQIAAKLTRADAQRWQATAIEEWGAPQVNWIVVACNKIARYSGVNRPSNTGDVHSRKRKRSTSRSIGKSAFTPCARWDI